MSSKTTTWWWLVGVGGAFGALVWWARSKGAEVVTESSAAEGESEESSGILAKVTAAVVGAWKWFSRPSTTNLQTADIWYSLDAPVQSDESARSNVMLEAVIDQFDVARNPRYTPRTLPDSTKKSTFCNIFAQDVARAMGVDLPWGNANTLVDYLGSSEAADSGWWAVSGAEAQEQANAGRLAITAWKNPGGTGHVQVVRPGSYSTSRGPTVAQAGATNYGSGTVTQGVGAARLPSVLYYAHA